MLKLSRNNVIDRLVNTNGRIFKVRFIKRTTGELRELMGRFGVRKGINGEGARYDFKEKGLLPVYLMNGDENRDQTEDAKNWRTIPTESITSAVIDGVEITVI